MSGLSRRVIPSLLMDRGRLVKTTGFTKPVYVGDPINTIRVFNDKGCDELLLLDISAGERGEGPDIETVRSVASECFMPLAYGGGIKSLEHGSPLRLRGREVGDQDVGSSATLARLGSCGPVRFAGGGGVDRCGSGSSRPTGRVSEVIDDRRGG